MDDNADMRDYLKRLLSQRWQVETVANGAIALNLIQQHPPDLVLADVMMPEIDGFQLLKILRSDLITQSIPIILLSARAGEEATVEGLAAGADDYLNKPFSARELVARVILGWARFLQTKSLDPDTTVRALATIERNGSIEAKLIKSSYTTGRSR